MTMTWKNGRQLATLQTDENNISYSYDSNSVRISKTVNGVKYTYAYINGFLMYETRGNAKFYYSYDANGTLYSVKYTLTDSSDLMTYYFTHNSRGDIVGIYNGAGQLRAHYEYDAWGNTLSVTDQNGNAITSATHIGNLNPFRYRGYYLDTETGLYYLMSRYYDPVTHRFVNADGYFQSGENVLDANMSAYCRNNPISFVDPTGTKCLQHDPYYVPNCYMCNPSYAEFELNNQAFLARAKKTGNEWIKRKDSKHGSENRQPTGDRQRNVGHPNGEEHSRVPKGNGLKRMEAAGLLVVSFVATIYLVGNDVTGVGAADDIAIAPTIALMWDSVCVIFG